MRAAGRHVESPARKLPFNQTHMAPTLSFAAVSLQNLTFTSISNQGLKSSQSCNIQINCKGFNEMTNIFYYSMFEALPLITLTIRPSLKLGRQRFFCKSSGSTE